MDFFFLKVKKITTETYNTKTIKFYFNKKFNYKEGQFLTLLLSIKNKKQIIKSYSFSTSVYIDKFPSITVKRVINGVASNYINDNLLLNDLLELVGPSGNFFLKYRYYFNNKHFLFLGAGSGITPLISIIKLILFKKRFIVSLIYVNKNDSEVIFKNKINNIQLKYKNKFNLIHNFTRVLSV